MSVSEKYQWQDGMGEISGFRGGYEQACRDMLRAGLLWLDDHPDADPHFQGFKGVYGLVTEDNDDAKALSDVMVKAAPDCTRAMHQATVTAALWISKNGWNAYVQQMSKPKAASS